MFAGGRVDQLSRGRSCLGAELTVSREMQSHCSGVIKEYKWPRITPKNMDSRCAAIHILWCVLCGYATGKDTREGKIGHSVAAPETGSTVTASAKHSGHSVGKTTQCCQWQSLSITCCSRRISGVYVIRGYLKDASHKNKRPIRLYVVLQFCKIAQIKLKWVFIGVL